LQGRKRCSNKLTPRQRNVACLSVLSGAPDSSCFPLKEISASMVHQTIEGLASGRLGPADVASWLRVRLSPDPASPQREAPGRAPLPTGSRAGRIMLAPVHAIRHRQHRQARPGPFVISPSAGSTGAASVPRPPGSCPSPATPSAPTSWPSRKPRGAASPFPRARPAGPDQRGRRRRGQSAGTARDHPGGGTPADRADHRPGPAAGPAGRASACSVGQENVARGSRRGDGERR
jgi:hypothetical protein